MTRTGGTAPTTPAPTTPAPTTPAPITPAPITPAHRTGRSGILIARAGLALVALLCADAVLPLSAGSAAAAAPAAPIEVLVSSDGVHFTPGLRGALIGTGDALVPGAEVITELWVRNPAPMPADLRISVGDIAEASPDFAEAVTLTAWEDRNEDRDEDGDAEATPIPFAELSSCTVLLEPGTLQPGETARFGFRFAMADVTGSTGQRESAALTLVVAMREATAGPLPDAGCGADAAPGEVAQDGPPAPSATPAAAPATPDTDRFPASDGPTAHDGFLAYTGSAPGAAAPLAAALLIGAGAALARTRTRSSTDD